MSRLFRALCCLILVGVLFAAYPRAAMACSCVLPPDPPDALATADTVFMGRAVAAIDSNPGPFVSSADPIQTTFQVSRSWKGAPQGILNVSSARFDASCGIRFEIGKEYLVYAYVQNGGLAANLCTRTALLANAQQDLNALGPGQVVTVTNAPLPSFPSAIVIGGALAGVLFLALLGAGIFLVRKRD